MIRKKRIKKNLRKYPINHIEKRATKLVETISRNIGIQRLFELIFEDELTQGWPVEYKSFDELVKMYSHLLTSEQLMALKELIYEQKS